MRGGRAEGVDPASVNREAAVAIDAQAIRRRCLEAEGLVQENNKERPFQFPKHRKRQESHGKSIHLA